MENISIKTMPNYIRNFLDMEDGVLKNIKYRKDIVGSKWFDSHLCKKDDGVIYYSETTRVVGKGNKKYFIRQVKKTGFTFTGKKLEFWYGASIKDFISDAYSIFHTLKIDWWKCQYSQYLTKGLMEKVMLSKITNPTDFARAILKLYRIENGSHKLLLKAMTDHNFNKRIMLRALQTCKNFNHYLNFLTDKRKTDEGNAIWPILEDMQEQALQLECKIDYTWSHKRIHNEHTNMTMKLMEYEGQNLSDEPLEHLLTMKEVIPVLPSMKLLTSEKEVFVEGSNMKHCVYTNYWDRIKDRRYLVFHIHMNDQDWTLGLNMLIGSRCKLDWNQLYGYKNTWAPYDVQHTIKTWFDEIKENKDVKQACKKWAPTDEGVYVGINDDF